MSSRPRPRRPSKRSSPSSPARNGDTTRPRGRYTPPNNVPDRSRSASTRPAYSRYVLAGTETTPRRRYANAKRRSPQFCRLRRRPRRQAGSRPIATERQTRSSRSRTGSTLVGPCRAGRSRSDIAAFESTRVTGSNRPTASSTTRPSPASSEGAAPLPSPPGSARSIPVSGRSTPNCSPPTKNAATGATPHPTVRWRSPFTGPAGRDGGGSFHQHHPNPSTPARRPSSDSQASSSEVG